MADTIESLAGTIPDTEVATRLGIAITEVKAWRRDHGVEPYRQAPPKAEKPTAEPPPRSGGRRIVRRRDGVQQTVVREPAPVPAANREGTERPAPKHSLDALRDRLGKVSDDEIARLAGVSRSTVVGYRKARGIAPYSAYLFQPGHTPARKARTAKPPTPDPKPAAAKPVAADLEPVVGTGERATKASRVDPYRHLVGVQTDQAVAEAAGVTRAAVQQYRRKHDIEAARPKGRRATVKAVATSKATKVGTRTSTTRLLKAQAARPTLRAYRLVLTGPGGGREAYGVGVDMAEACGLALGAVRGLGAGPWDITEAVLVGRVLG